MDPSYFLTTFHPFHPFSCGWFLPYIFAPNHRMRLSCNVSRFIHSQFHHSFPNNFNSQYFTFQIVKIFESFRFFLLSTFITLLSFSLSELTVRATVAASN